MYTVACHGCEEEMVVSDHHGLMLCQLVACQRHVALGSCMRDVIYVVRQQLNVSTARWQSAAMQFFKELEIAGSKATWPGLMMIAVGSTPPLIHRHYAQNHHFFRLLRSQTAAASEIPVLLFCLLMLVDSGQLQQGLVSWSANYWSWSEVCAGQVGVFITTRLQCCGDNGELY